MKVSIIGGTGHLGFDLAVRLAAAGTGVIAGYAMEPPGPRPPRPVEGAFEHLPRP